MIGALAALFIAVPLAELWVLLQLSDAVGAGNTIGIVVATGVVGAVFARRQGLATLRRIEESVRIGQSPGRALVDGGLVLAGGLMLLTPGVITDAAGFFLLLPFTRPLVRDRVLAYVRRRAVVVRGPSY